MIVLNAFPLRLLKAGAVACLSLAAISSSYASDSDRITLLEKEVQEPKLRLLKLETPETSAIKQQKPVASSEGWKSLANWPLAEKGDVV